MPKKHFYLRLNPPRASFIADMTDEEKLIMQKHGEYWRPYTQDGTVIVLGPVFDPKAGFGMAVLQVDDEKQLEALIAKDPALAIGSYEIYPMRASSNLVLPE